MTDRELLELAAKAAGYEIEGDADHLVAQPGRYAGGFSILNDRGGSSLWNPLTDDGDALRLAVKLWMRVEVNDGSIVIQFQQDDLGNTPEPLYEYPQSDYDEFNRIVHVGHDAATRRAIVRAAAEIGRAMKEE